MLLIAMHKQCVMTRCGRRGASMNRLISSAPSSSLVMPRDADICLWLMMSFRKLSEVAARFHSDLGDVAAPDI